ncbi:transglutaminase family protein [Salinibacterium hongtaonis]|uniref:transglutaminase family protein n=1 Tax=Homoserinimonas hongtaonis TaxID=2079791 RepID=UPI000D3BF38E|nr:transglutaminase family protein [Salinibacterium hongtaonis]AWB88202.1 transglutaminase [Salinibacterium hongtaonis]
MNRLRVRHITGFRYTSPVAASYNEARMLPITTDGQFVLHASIDIQPASSHHEYMDYWGSRVSAFEALSGHHELSLTSTSLVEVSHRRHDHEAIGWDDLAAEVERLVETVEHLEQSERTTPPAELAELAVAIAETSAGPCDAARRICIAIGEQLDYVSGITGVNSTAAEAWVERKGVCQDFAHLALGALRSIGIPARYVSGYLHPDPEPIVGVTQEGESHAWVEWFCGVWCGFDPTNGIDIGDRHVLVGRGRDYGDVPPLKGVYSGGTASEMFVRVDITREA